MKLIIRSLITYRAVLAVSLSAYFGAYTRAIGEMEECQKSLTLHSSQSVQQIMDNSFRLIDNSLKRMSMDTSLYRINQVDLTLERPSDNCNFYIQEIPIHYGVEDYMEATAIFLLTVIS